MNCFRRIVLRVCVCGSLFPVPCSLSGPAWSSSTQDIRVEGSTAFLEGKFSGCGLNDLGELVMGLRAPKSQPVEDAAYILASAASGGKTYFGTGHPAAVIAYDGKTVSAVARFGSEIAVTAIASSGRHIYAATLPSAAIYRIDPKGDTELFADFASSASSPNYIWDMAVHRGSLYAALGGHFPSVYKIDLSSGQKTLVHKVNGRAKNVTALLVTEKELFFGDDAGRVFRWAEGGPAAVLYAFSDAEVKSLAMMEDGIAVAVNGRRVIPPPPPPQAKDQAKAGEEPGEEDAAAPEFKLGLEAALETVAVAVDTELARPNDQGGSGAVQEVRGGQKPPPPPPQLKNESPAAQGQSFPPVYQDPFGKGEGNLFWMSADGSSVHRLWFSQSSIVLSILPDADGVWVATSNPGRLYRIGRTGAERLFYESTSKDISVITKFSRDLLAAASNPAVLSELRQAENGDYVSKVFDASFPARLGRPEVLGAGAESAEMMFRSGSTADVDSGWSDFKSLSGVPPQPSGRFFQIKLRLKSSESAVRRLRVPYRVQNVYPRLVNLSSDIAPAQDGSVDGRDVRLQWDAVNLDNDILQYQISYRPPGAKKFIPVFEPSERPRNVKNYNLPAEHYPDGMYTFRLDVTDEPSNGAGESLTHSAEFPMVLLDRTPPAVELEQDRAEIRWAAADAVSRITRIEYRVDGGPWRSALSQDGLFDSSREAGSIPAKDVPGGSVIDVRAFDERDNSRIYSLIAK